MPGLGSTARSWLTAWDHSGCASKARVKMPVPAPILLSVLEQEDAGQYTVMTYSTILIGEPPLTEFRM